MMAVESGSDPDEVFHESSRVTYFKGVKALLQRSSQNIKTNHGGNFDNFIKKLLDMSFIYSKTYSYQNIYF